MASTPRPGVRGTGKLSAISDAQTSASASSSQSREPSVDGLLRVSGAGIQAKKKKKKKAKSHWNPEAIESVSSIATPVPERNEFPNGDIVHNGGDLENSQPTQASHIPGYASPPQLLFNGNIPCYQRGSSFKKHSIVSDVFQGIERSQVTCLNCRRESFTYDPFLTILVEIGRHGPPGEQGSNGWLSSLQGLFTDSDGLTLEECLSRYTNIEHIDRYTCEHCGVTRQSTKTLRFQALPEVLVIVLKRFHHDEREGARKIKTAVHFPLAGLDMDAFMVEDAELNLGSPSGQRNLYNLSGIINHRGGMGGGHYVAYARNFTDQQWYEYDDGCVSRVASAKVAGTEAYVLLYKRDDSAVAPLRTELYKMVSTLQEESLFVISRQWFHRFLTMSEPGPINNRDVCCEHGGVNPSLTHHATNYFVRVTVSVYHFLHSCFGGGPAVHILSTCVPCEQTHAVLQERRHQEFQQVKQHKDEQSEDSSDTIYALPNRWYMEWRSFIRSHHPDHSPPGPIEMHHLRKPDGTLNERLGQGIHYQAVPETLWNYLAKIYGVCGEPVTCT